MKKFLRQTAVFAFLMLILIGSAEMYVERMPNPYRYKHEYMQLHADEIETLVLGSSHTYYGICPSDLGDNSFSLANISQTYRYDLYLLNHYDMPRLHNVILPFSYFSLWSDYEDQKTDDNYIIYYRLYMDCDIHPRIGRYGLECFCMPSMTEKLRALFKPRRMTWDEKGCGTNYTFESRDPKWDNGKFRAAVTTFSDTTLIEPNANRLNDIASYCAGHDIQLTLVRTPVTDSYIKYTDKSQEDINDKVLLRFLSSHPDVNFVDLYRDDRFDDADFFDSDHLNTNGAHKLSAILRTYLNSKLQNPESTPVSVR